MELSAVVDIFLRSPDPEMILDFLDRNGSHKDLLELIHRFEDRGVYLPFYYLCDNWCALTRLFEVPTDELCANIVMTLSALKITRVIEVAAGSGLLSARLKRKIPSVEFVVTSKPCSCDCVFTFTHVCPKTFQQIKEKKTPVIISWLHINEMSQFLAMIKKNKPSVVFFVGSATSIDFREITRLMTNRGYDFFIIPGAQVNTNTISTGSNNGSHTRNYMTIFFRNETHAAVLDSLPFYTLPVCPSDERSVEDGLIDEPFDKQTDDEVRRQTIELLLTF
jgi:hypothetical protein